MKTAATYMKKMKERMKSPLALAAGNLPGCKITGSDRAEVTLDGKTITLAMDGNQCLYFKGKLEGKRITGKRAFQYACRQCRRPQIFKYMLEDRVLTIVSEYYLGDTADTEPYVKAALAAIRDGMAVDGGPHDDVEEEVSGTCSDQIHEVLDPLPYGFRRAGAGWMGAYDSQHYLHRITAAASAVQGAQTLRFEISGDVLSGDNKRVWDALALFTLEANAKLRYVRVSVLKHTTGALTPYIETVLPVQQLTVPAVRAHLAALIAGADRVRAVAAGLTSPEVAKAYLQSRAGALHSGRKTVAHE